jgi:hypothetical protein
VLGPDVVVSERARFVARCAERERDRADEAERWLSGCWIGDGSEPLLCGLFAGAERAADFPPTRSGGACRVDELIEELVTAGAELVGQRSRGAQLLERGSCRDLRREPIDARNWRQPSSLS